MSIPGLREFKLAGPKGNGRDLYLNENGAFIANAVPLLDKDNDGLWRPKAKPELEKMLSKICGVPIDIGARMLRLNAVAKALNKNDYALANISLVLLQLPIGTDDFFGSDEIAKYDPNQPRGRLNFLIER